MHLQKHCILHVKQIEKHKMELQKFKQIVCIVSIKDVKADKSNHNTLLDVLGKNYRNNQFYTTHINDLNNYKYLLINKNGANCKDSISISDSWDIILANDDKIEFTDELVFNMNTMVMYHSYPNDSLKQLHGKVYKHCLGFHEDNVSKGYLLLKGIIDAWDGTTKKFTETYEQAIKKLAKWFRYNDKRITALIFLHNCLGHGVGNPKILTDAGFNLELKINGEQSMWEFIIALSSNEDKIAALRMVRDTLLEETEKE